MLLYKIRLLKWLTKPACSGIKMDNLRAIHYYCLECLWSIIMRKRNQLNQKTKKNTKNHKKKTHNKVIVINYKTPKGISLKSLSTHIVVELLRLFPLLLTFL